MKQFLTITQIAERIGTSRQAVNKFIHKHNIPYEIAGKTILIDTDTVNQYWLLDGDSPGPKPKNSIDVIIDGKPINAKMYSAKRMSGDRNMISVESE